MRKLYIIFMCLMTAIGMEAQEYRDVVFLKNGSVIKGFYKELYPSDTLRMETIDGGMLVCAMSDVERIAKERVKMYVVKEDDFSPSYRIWRPKGYRGFVEFGTGFYVDDMRLTVSGVSTTHGYQFNRNWFMGLTIQLDKYNYNYEGYDIQPSSNNFLLAYNVRFYILKKKVSPFLGITAGYNVTGYKGPKLTGTLGGDFALSPRMGLLVSLNYDMMFTKKEDDMTCYNYLSLSVGIHF